MIVVSESDIYLAVTQPDHAHFSGQLASLWRAGALPDNPRRQEILFACREHDNGWREADSAPRVDPETGRPHDFRSTPWAVRAEIWHRGVERFAPERPYAALLIAEHAHALHQGERRRWREAGAPGDSEFGRFFTWLDDQREALREAAGAGSEEAAADYRFVSMTDLVSLAACSRREESFERYDVRGRYRDGSIELEPFPLAGSTTFRVACRRIPKRMYTSDGDLAVELASASWEEMAVRVVRAL